jgi:hypothetical protein
MKILKVIGTLMAIGGFILVLGISGGLERDACTYGQFFMLGGIGLAMMILGLPLARADEEDEK